jgi:hypothetical protein
MRQIHHSSRKMKPLLLILLILSVLGTGCAAGKAIRQKDKKDLSILRPGAPRSILIAELGYPAVTHEKENGQIDVYLFNRGYSQFTKWFRATLHVAGDIFTLFIWEFLGMSIEDEYTGVRMKAIVVYDQDDKVKEYSLCRPLPSQVMDSCKSWDQLNQ